MPAGTWKPGDRGRQPDGFGAMRLAQTGRVSAAEPRPGEAAVTVLRRAVELGVNHIDTASLYPDDLVVVTKVGPSRDAAGEWPPAASWPAWSR